jgi:hypothetical protein
MRYASTVLLRGAWALAAEHRGWLKTAVEGLLTRQHCEGTWCAFKEELSHPGWGGSTRVPDNADYGTFEAPLNQANDDPVSDFLYTSNFALLGLHEAAAALGDPAISAVEDKLADYIVRLQARRALRFCSLRPGVAPLVRPCTVGSRGHITPRWLAGAGQVHRAPGPRRRLLPRFRLREVRLSQPARGESSMGSFRNQPRAAARAP